MYSINFVASFTIVPHGTFITCPSSAMPLLVSTSGQGTYLCVLNGYVVWLAFLLPVIEMPPVTLKILTTHLIQANGAV
jgi:hypothetical protein